MAADFYILLGRGEANAIPMHALAAQLGINDRTLRKQIFEARVEGIPILSGNEGYYLPGDDRSELREYERTARKRALSSLKMARSAKEHCKQIPGQLSFADLR